jgi:hypothetical protein
VARLSSSLPVNDEFVGMADYFMESIHDLLASDSESISGSISSKGSHHPSRECFMAKTSDGHISSASDSGETPREVPVVRVQEGRGSTSNGDGLSPTTAGTTTHRVAADRAA